MRVLIPGGTGFIGRALVDDLVRSGDEPIILTRRPASDTGLPAAAEPVQWDAQSLGDWAAIVSSVDAIVNLAGENIGSWPWTQAKKLRIAQSRENTGSLLVKALSRAHKRPSVFLQSSAIGYYGPSEGQAIDESAPNGHDWLADVASLWEASTQEVEEMGVRRAIMRTGLVLGRGGGLLPRLMLPFRLFAGGRMGTGRQTMSWIHIEDTVRAIRYLIEHPEATGPVNLTAPGPVTNTEFSRTLGSVMRRRAWFPVPAWLLRIVLGEMSVLVLDGQRVHPRRLESMGFTFRYSRLDDALNDLLRPKLTSAATG